MSNYSPNKEQRYKNLISQVKKIYPLHIESAENASDSNVILEWCEDCEEINLWTYWQGRHHLSPKILLVGQDWGCPWDKSALSVMNRIREMNSGLTDVYLDDIASITDKNLALLFQELGYNINTNEEKNSDLFFTNFVLGYRSKGTSGFWNKQWAVDCEPYFAELADILAPQVILCLGKETFEGVCRSLGQVPPAEKTYNALVESDKIPLSAATRSGHIVKIFALAHCGSLGTLNRNRQAQDGKIESENGLEKQKSDWRRIRPYLRQPEYNAQYMDDKFEKYLHSLSLSGADPAIIIDPKQVITAPWPAFKCQFGCENYGKGYGCPPHTPKWQETRAILDSYRTGILFRVHDWNATSIARTLSRDLFLDGYYKSIAFGSGPCKLCPTCAFPESCRFPSKAIPSMEACGIDVFGTAQRFGLEIHTLRCADEERNHFGLILIE